MRNNVKKLMLVIILLLAVGFAAVSTTLIINGTANFGTNEDDFDVYFSYAELDGVDKSDTIIATNGKSITFETRELSKVEDASILKFEVTNNSTQYDANIIMECIAESNNSEYYTITNTIPSVIASKTIASGTVTATLKKVSTEAISENFTCTITANAVERTEVGTDGSEGIGEVNTYSMYGYLTDAEGEAIPNANLVIYSETPHYATTDENGYFYVEGLEVGTHEIYYVGEVDATELTKEEVKNVAIDKTEVTTSSKKIEFETGHKIVESTIEKTNNATYEISFDTDGGSSISNKTVTKNSEYGELPEPTKTGYTFVGWKTSEGKKVTESSIVTKDSAHTLIAEYNENTYTIEYNANTGTGSISSQEVKYTEEVEIKSNTFTKTGYTFAGWNTAANGTGTTYKEKDVVSKIAASGSITLYAQWTVNKYTATISASNATLSAKTVSVAYGSTNTFTITPASGYALSAISCTNGYTVSGFTTGVSATGKQTVTIKNNNKTSNTTCTATMTLACAYSTGQTWTYDYSGSSKTFTVPCAGTYKLEVWGAQGGNYSSAVGGKGGYSYGNKVLAKGNNLYIGVGGQNIGYNGGSSYSYLGGGNMGGAGGGGATHIATGTTNRGELKNYASYKSEVLIVAGGGGGAGFIGDAWDGSNHYLAGGTGGGTTGASGNLVQSLVGTVGMVVGQGGSQSAAGTQANYSSYPVNRNSGFGEGGIPNLSSMYTGGGGGGGYYGGGAGYQGVSGGGGSGYIGGVTGGATSNGQRSGNGYARITLVSLS